jgi:RNA polymerase sigma-70 factor (ECF subfamily)
MSGNDFNTILIGNADFLKPVAISLTRDNESALDLFQETLYRALINRDKYNIGTNIKAWLYTIMRNIFINDYRRKVKQRTIFENTSDENFANLNQGSVANAAESNIRTKEIKEAIEQLPEIYKTPFVLYFDGYHYNEIAQSLKEPLGTIKSRIHFARKLLKDQLSRY